jgi:hypothetical protein
MVPGSSRAGDHPPHAAAQKAPANPAAAQWINLDTSVSLRNDALRKAFSHAEEFIYRIQPYRRVVALGGTAPRCVRAGEP